MIRSVALILLLSVAAPGFAGSNRAVEATYVGTVANIPPGTAKIRVWVPLPQSGLHQTVSDVRIESPYSFKKLTEREFGNRYAVATVDNPPETLEVKVHFRAERSEAAMAALEKSPIGRAERRRALRADRLVTLSPRIRNLAAEVTAGKKTVTEKARAIYDYVLSTMTYDKTAPGWGNGDTERACDIKKGNCTDFHSLFISLARAAGIPSRFVIGFPLTATDGQVRGYHCWAEFHDGERWVPVDPSDASKSSDPARRDYLFGNLDPHRLQLTIGRDLVLSPPTAEPLNYFLTPRAEAAGKGVGESSVTLEFRDIPRHAALEK